MKKSIMIIIMMFLLMVLLVSATLQNSFTTKDTGIKRLNSNNIISCSKITATDTFYVGNMTQNYQTFTGSPTVILEIWSDDGGSPSKPLALLDQLCTITPDGNGDFNCQDPTPTTQLTNTNVYWVCGRGGLSNDASNYVDIYGGSSAANLYAESTDSGANWANSGYELYYYLYDYTPVSITNFSIEVHNYFNNNSVLNAWAYVDGTNYTTSNGTITTGLQINDTNLYNISIGDGSNSHFTREYLNINVTGNLTAYLIQSIVTPQAYEKITNNSLSGVYTINGSTNTTFWIDNNTLNVSFSNTSYFTKILEFNVSSLYNGSINLTNVTSTLLNITLYNAFSGEQLTNFSGWIADLNNYSYNESYAAAGNIAFVNITKGINYTISVTKPGYSINNSVINLTNINSSFEIANFTLYSNNSLLISIYDADTSLIITDNMTVVLSGNSTESTKYTTNGTLFYDNLTDSSYTVKISGTNYALTTYSVTVADNSFQTLNAYISKSTSTVTFTWVDINSLVALQGTSVTMQRLVNSTWTIVSSKNSDIIGKTQFEYVPGVKYRFTGSKTDYTSKTFDLDPITETAYTVRLTPEITVTDEPDNWNIDIIYDPSIFYDNRTTNFTFTISSPGGSLSNYGFNITYPGGYINRSGSNAYGTTFIVPINISGATYDSTIIFYYYYDTVIDTPKEYTINMEIILSSVGNSTFININSFDLGLSTTTKVLIVVFCAMLVSGLLAYFTYDGTLSVIGAMVVFGLFAGVGFISHWLVIIPIIITILILAGADK